MLSRMSSALLKGFEGVEEQGEDEQSGKCTTRVSRSMARCWFSNSAEHWIEQPSGSLMSQFRLHCGDDATHVAVLDEHAHREHPGIVLAAYIHGARTRLESGDLRERK